MIVGAKYGFAIMNRNTKKLEYIKKVWEDRDGPGKDERYANVLRGADRPETLQMRRIPGCVSMAGSSITKVDTGPVQ